MYTVSRHRHDCNTNDCSVIEVQTRDTLGAARILASVWSYRYPTSNPRYHDSASIEPGSLSLHQARNIARPTEAWVNGGCCFTHMPKEPAHA
jgi:hypothetical protein